MRVAFFGTPDFAIPSLRTLHESKHQLVCVVTQPDKPSGRGGAVVFSPVKKYALENNIPVLQPEKISDNVKLLDKFKPEIIVTCAFGQFLKRNVLDYCLHGVINVHGSLLPKYRGSCPIQWAVINGERETGITIMQTDIGMDTGDIVLQMPIDINEDETAGELFGRLSVLGSKALITALAQIENGTAVRTVQDNSKATSFPKFSKESGRIDWRRTAFEIANQVRGMNPWPMAFFKSRIGDIRVHKATPFKTKTGKGLFIACKDSFLRLDIVQAPGAKAVSGLDFLNGRSHVFDGETVLR